MKIKNNKNNFALDKAEGSVPRNVGIILGQNDFS